MVKRKTASTNKHTKEARRRLYTILAGLALAVIVFAGFASTYSTDPATTVTRAAGYRPKINPREFTTDITNKYFTLKKGTKIVYEEQTPEGLERTEITITGKTKSIMGVNTLIYRDIVTLDGELIEDTRDYLAQDKKGNVWYFGEDVDNYENGKIANHDGSWLAGVDGAQPGIWMKSAPEVGDSYRQEFYKGEAEDMADILALNETVTVPFGTFTNCVKTYDWTPLDPEAQEHKYYCPEIGAMVLSEHLIDETRAELVDLRVEPDLVEDEDSPETAEDGNNIRKIMDNKQKRTSMSLFQRWFGWLFGKK